MAISFLFFALSEMSRWANEDETFIIAGPASTARSAQRKKTMA
ncbi:MAG TPA: hypothetical protein VGA72_00825 [Anaerolineales bacterium]